MAPSTLASPAERGGVAYCETTLWRSYAQAIRHLHDVGGPPPATTAG